MNREIDVMIIDDEQVVIEAIAKVGAGYELEQLTACPSRSARPLHSQ